MKTGKKICRELKGIRKKIADANGIKYEPTKCNHRGDCAGTCPACDAEIRYIEHELNLRRLAGKAAVVAGLSLSVASLSSCHKILSPVVRGKMINPREQLVGDVPNERFMDSTKYQLEGDVAKISPDDCPSNANDSVKAKPSVKKNQKK